MLYWDEPRFMSAGVRNFQKCTLTHEALYLTHKLEELTSTRTQTCVTLHKLSTIQHYAHRVLSSLHCEVTAIRSCALVSICALRKSPVFGTVYGVSQRVKLMAGYQRAQ